MKRLHSESPRCGARRSTEVVQKVGEGVIAQCRAVPVLDHPQVIRSCHLLRKLTRQLHAVAESMSPKQLGLRLLEGEVAAIGQLVVRGG